MPGTVCIAREVVARNNLSGENRDGSAPLEEIGAWIAASALGQEPARCHHSCRQSGVASAVTVNRARPMPPGHGALLYAGGANVSGAFSRRSSTNEQSTTRKPRFDPARRGMSSALRTARDADSGRRGRRIVVACTRPSRNLNLRSRSAASVTWGHLASRLVLVLMNADRRRWAGSGGKNAD